MRTIIERYVKYGILCGIFALLMIIPSQVVFAGEINSNEAGLIAAASGTFTYEGKTYRAGSAYINSLTTYLSEDDVDLTAEQCESAMSQMYASVAEGVERGYLYEVGAEDTGEESTTESEDQKEKEDKKDQSSKKDKEQQSDKDQSSGSSDDSTDASAAGADGSNAGLTDTDGLDVWESMSNQTEAKNKLKSRPEKDDAGASVTLENDSIVVTTKDNEKINLSKNEQLVPDSVIYIIDSISIVVFGITIFCIVILLITKCMVFKKRKSRHARPGHTRRRRIRRYTRNIMTFTTAIAFLVIFLLVGIYISIFNKNTIMQNMQASGYFRYAYSEYISGLASEYQEGGVAAIQDDIASYEEYLFTVKQNSLKILDGETEIRIPDSNVTPYITNIKKSYVKLFSVAGTLFILSALLGVVFMVFMDQQRERGVKHIGFAELLASAILVGVTIYMAFMKPYLYLYIEPDYLYLFIMECILWSVKVMTSISAFAVVLGMLLVGIYKSMSNKSDS